MNKLVYRPEIDGLRAIAVLAVLFFHAGLGFPGGYIGVDVFFVISGFLITGLIVKDLEGGKFQLVDFWERRIRRIFPALTVMVVGTLAVGSLVLLPPDFEELARSAIAQVALSANFHFRDNTGYFSGPAELKPLLHTWSLAVEEQFYLVLPPLLMAFRRFSRRQLTWLLACIASASFVLSVWGTHAFLNSTFYLLPTRAWELLLGSLLAVAWPAVTLPARFRSLLSWGGLSGIVVVSLWYDKHTLFPGWNALAPCLAGAAFIAGNTAGLTSSGRLLASWPLVLVGRMSYSLYLWHWPVLAFLRHVYGVNLPLGLSWFAVGLSFVMAWLSWKFVETPLRRPAALPRRWVFGLATVSSLLVLVASLGIVQAKGFRNRYSPEVLQALDSGGIADQFASESIVPIGAALPPGGQGKFLLWGDSHAQAIGELVHELSVNQGVSGYFICRSWTIPVPGTWMTSRRRSSANWNANVLEFIKNEKIEHVILASRWAVAIDGVPGGSLKTLVVDDLTQEPSQQESREVVRRGLKQLLTELNASGVKVWLMRQVPQQPTDDAARQLARSLHFHLETAPKGVSLAEHRRYQADINQVFDELPQDQVRLLDPTPHCFDDSGYAILWKGHHAYYSDDDHLSRYGVQELLTPLLEPVIREISGEPNLIRQASGEFLQQTSQNVDAGVISR